MNVSKNAFNVYAMSFRFINRRQLFILSHFSNSISLSFQLIGLTPVHQELAIALASFVIPFSLTCFISLLREWILYAAIGARSYIHRGKNCVKSARWIFHRDEKQLSFSFEFLIISFFFIFNFWWVYPFRLFVHSFIYFQSVWCMYKRLKCVE